MNDKIWIEHSSNLQLSAEHKSAFTLRHVGRFHMLQCILIIATDVLTLSAGPRLVQNAHSWNTHIIIHTHIQTLHLSLFLSLAPHTYTCTWNTVHPQSLLLCWFVSLSLSHTHTHTTNTCITRDGLVKWQISMQRRRDGFSGVIKSTKKKRQVTCKPSM